MEKRIQSPEHLDKCLPVRSDLEDHTSSLPLRGTRTAEPGWGFLCVSPGRRVMHVSLLSMGARLNGDLGGAHLWLEVGVAVEQW